MIIIMIITITLQIKKTPLVPQDQGLARVLGVQEKIYSTENVYNNNNNNNNLLIYHSAF